jgi:MFS family permease
MAASIGIALFGLLFAPLLGAGSEARVILFMALGLGLMGLTYGPIGTMLSEQFPTLVRYTGASLTFNLAGIFGASVAPYIATWLATRYGVHTVGWYLSGAALLTLAALWGARETRDDA